MVALDGRIDGLRGSGIDGAVFREASHGGRGAGLLARIGRVDHAAVAIGVDRLARAAGRQCPRRVLLPAFTLSANLGDFGRAVTMIKNLPDGVSAADLVAHGPDYEQASFIIGMTYETSGGGNLAFRRDDETVVTMLDGRIQSEARA